MGELRLHPVWKGNSGWGNLRLDTEKERNVDPILALAVRELRCASSLTLNVNVNIDGFIRSRENVQVETMKAWRDNANAACAATLRVISLLERYSSFICGGKEESRSGSHPERSN